VRRGEKGASCVVASTQGAQRIVVRDMGNGVDRIEVHELIAKRDAKTHFRLPGCVRLQQSTETRFLGLIWDANTACIPLGCQACACARAIDDHTVEVFAICR
jgi:hypothetical protein